MRVVVQRVSQASVRVDGEIVGQIGSGLLVLLGVKKEDSPDAVDWLVRKVVDLRIFSDAQGKINLSLKDVDGELLVVSQFTLYGNCVQGRRPDFFQAAEPLFAETCYNAFIQKAAPLVKRVASGRFGAKMEVSLVNDGPVTLIIDR